MKTSAFSIDFQSLLQGHDLKFSFSRVLLTIFTFRKIFFSSFRIFPKNCQLYFSIMLGKTLKVEQINLQQEIKEMIAHEKIYFLLKFWIDSERIIFNFHIFYENYLQFISEPGHSAPRNKYFVNLSYEFSHLWTNIYT